MRRFIAKLRFIHRTLWQRDQAYRWAAVLGPPPLIGCALAALALAGWHRLPDDTAVRASKAPWANWTRPVPHGEQPYTEAPTAALPQTDAGGRFVGFQPGWTGEIRLMTLDATKDANVSSSGLASFTIDGPTFPLARVLDAGPSGGLFVGTAQTFFVVQTPGLYAFSARLVWQGAQSADCLVRLVTPRHTMLRNVTLNIESQGAVNYPPTTFTLQKGLLGLRAAAGCWRGDRAVGPGTLTLMVRRPGQAAFSPAAVDELIRPIQLGTAGER
jgi:hypothetical protein